MIRAALRIVPAPLRTRLARALIDATVDSIEAVPDLDTRIDLAREMQEAAELVAFPEIDPTLVRYAENCGPQAYFEKLREFVPTPAKEKANE